MEAIINQYEIFLSTISPKEIRSNPKLRDLIREIRKNLIGLKALKKD